MSFRRSDAEPCLAGFMWRSCRSGTTYSRSSKLVRSKAEGNGGAEKSRRGAYRRSAAAAIGPPPVYALALTIGLAPLGMDRPGNRRHCVGVGSDAAKGRFLSRHAKTQPRHLEGWAAHRGCSRHHAHSLTGVKPAAWLLGCHHGGGDHAKQYRSIAQGGNQSSGRSAGRRGVLLCSRRSHPCHGRGPGSRVDVGHRTAGFSGRLLAELSLQTLGRSVVTGGPVPSDLDDAYRRFAEAASNASQQIAARTDALATVSNFSFALDEVRLSITQLTDCVRGMPRNQVTAT